VVLDLERAISLGLALNELMSNSLKYACDDEGRCHMSLNTKIDDQGRLILRYWDDGPGLPKDLSLEKPKTLGLQLLAVLASQLGASLSRDEDNAACFILELALENAKAMGLNPPA
jgi:two-component sensor histidine kinase